MPRRRCWRESPVPNRLLDQSRDYGERVVADYRAGRNSRSRDVGVPEYRIDGDVEFQTMGRVCEVAGCLAVGLDPVEVLNWTRHPDPGFDFQYSGQFIDVKGTWHPKGRRLIWPVSKQHLYANAPFHILMLVKALPFGDPFFGLAWAEGWITKDAFFHAKIEARRDEHRMSNGTWFVDRNRLEGMADLVALQSALGDYAA